MLPSKSLSSWFVRVVGRWRSGSELRLSTPLSANEVLRRMGQASLKPDFFRLTGPAHSVVGRFKGHRFSLIAAQAIKRSQARYFYGEVLSNDTATVIRGRFQRSIALRIAESIIVGLVGLAGLFRSVRTGDPEPAVIALLGIAALVLLYRHRIRRS